MIINTLNVKNMSKSIIVINIQNLIDKVEVKNEGLSMDQFQNKVYESVKKAIEDSQAITESNQEKK